MWCSALVWILATGAAAESPAKRAYADARARYFALHDHEERQALRHNWLNVAGAFMRVVETYPTSPEAPLALYTAAELYSDLHARSRRAGDLEQALGYYGGVASRYPHSSLADDALYEQARLKWTRRQDGPGARRLVDTLNQAYPRSDMAARAQKLLSELPPATAQEPSVERAVGRQSSEKARVVSIRHWSNPVYTRVAIELTGPAEARSGAVPADAAQKRPARLFVDVLGAVLPPELSVATPVNDDLLLQLRAAQHVAASVRVVLDLKSGVRHRTMVMENPYRVVVDAFAGDEPAASARPALSERHVVLDPGHGGKDGGAVGPGGIREKDVVLALAKDAARLLTESGVRVTLTRKDDSQVSLEERTALANRLDADVFLSIHANSNKVKSVHGVETYYLDVTSDRYALRLAAVENNTSEEEVGDIPLILTDLANKASLPQSTALARLVQNRLVAAARARHENARDLGVKPSLFYVLLGARMPAALVETGFLSNGREAKLLSESTYQRAVAQALTDAVVDHLRQPVQLVQP